MGHRRAPEVDLDLDNIWFYVATNSGSAETADRLIDSIISRFSLLSKHPFLGRSRHEDLATGLRSLVAGEYLILYRVHEGEVVVLRVLRGTINLESLFRHD